MTDDRAGHLVSLADIKQTALLCRERAQSYGALRRSATTAIVLDRAAEAFEHLHDELERERGA